MVDVVVVVEVNAVVAVMVVILVAEVNAVAAEMVVFLVAEDNAVAAVMVVVVDQIGNVHIAMVMGHTVDYFWDKWGRPAYVNQAFEYPSTSGTTPQQPTNATTTSSGSYDVLASQLS